MDAPAQIPRMERVFVASALQECLIRLGLIKTFFQRQLLDLLSQYDTNSPFPDQEMQEVLENLPHRQYFVMVESLRAQVEASIDLTAEEISKTGNYSSLRKFLADQKREKQDFKNFLENQKLVKMEINDLVEINRNTKKEQHELLESLAQEVNARKSRLQEMKFFYKLVLKFKVKKMTNDLTIAKKTSTSYDVNFKKEIEVIKNGMENEEKAFNKMLDFMDYLIPQLSANLAAWIEKHKLTSQEFADKTRHLLQERGENRQATIDLNARRKLWRRILQEDTRKKEEKVKEFLEKWYKDMVASKIQSWWRFASASYKFYTAVTEKQYKKKRQR